MGFDYPRYDRSEQAVREAVKGAGLLVLADGYPSEATKVSESTFGLARAKNLRIYGVCSIITEYF